MKTIEELIEMGATIKHWGADYTLKETFKEFVYITRANGGEGVDMIKIKDALEDWHKDEAVRQANEAAKADGGPISKVFDKVGMCVHKNLTMNEESNHSYWVDKDSLHHSIHMIAIVGGFHHTKLGFEPTFMRRDSYILKRNIWMHPSKHSYTNTNGFHTTLGIEMSSSFRGERFDEKEDFHTDKDYKKNYNFASYLADLEQTFELFWMNLAQDLGDEIVRKGSVFMCPDGKFVYKINGFGFERQRDENDREVFLQTDKSKFSIERCSIYGAKDKPRYKFASRGTAAVPKKFTTTMTKDELRVELRAIFDEMLEVNNMQLPYQEAEDKFISEMKASHEEWEKKKKANA